MPEYIDCLIVDDDQNARAGLRRTVPWDLLGLRLVGEATNGRDAIGRVTNGTAEILLLDVVMPQVNGLEVCRTVHAMDRPCKIVVISGHDDFSYAQQALQAGVIDYVLKPVKKEHLIRALLRAKTELLRDQSLSDRQRTEEATGLSMPLFRDAISGLGLAMSTETRPRKRVVSILRLFPGEHPGSTEQRADMRSFWSEALDALGKHGPVFVHRIAGTALTVGCIQDDGLPDTDLEETIGRLRSRMDCDVAAGVSTPFAAVTDADDRLREAEVAMDASFTHGLNRVHRFGPASIWYSTPAPTTELSVAGNYVDAFAEAISDGSADRIRNLVDSLLPDEGYSRHELQARAIQLLMELEAIVGIAFPSELLRGLVQPELDERPQKWATLVALRQSMAVAIDEIARQRREMQIAGSGHVVWNAVRIMEKEYASITLESLADKVGFSPNHLSSVFKMRTGRNFRELLWQIRFEQAKKLLRSTTLKVYEVAIQVGFSDVRSFRKRFRSETGQTPHDFRESGP